MTKTRWQPAPAELLAEIATARAYYLKKAKALTPKNIAKAAGFVNYAGLEYAFQQGELGDEMYELLWEWWSLASLHYPHRPTLVRE